MLAQQTATIGTTFAFDGKMLFLNKNIGNQVLTVDVGGVSYRVEIVLTKNIAPNEPPPLQFCNLLFRKLLRILKLEPIGRQYFNPRLAVNVPAHGLQIWPGYFTSIIPTDRGTALNADVAHKIIRTQSVWEYMDYLWQSGLDERQIEAEVVGQSVLTKYNNRNYRVDGIDWDKTPNNTFPTADGDEVSFVEYYTSQYKQKILFASKQPLLVVRRKTKSKEKPEEIIYLVPELCLMTGLTDEMKSNFTLMNDVAVHTRVAPAQRVKEWNQLINQVKNEPEAKKALTEWNAEVQGAAEIKASVVPRQPIILAQGRKVDSGPRCDWSGAYRDNKIAANVDLKYWIIAYPGKIAPEVENFLANLQKISSQLGFNVAAPKQIVLDSDNTNAFLSKITPLAKPPLQLIFYVLPGTKGDRYAILKTAFSDMRVPSQCVLLKTIKKNLSVVSKIAQQMCAKINGKLWKPEARLANTMIVGMDVCHDTAPGGRKSVVGFCATMDESFTEYYSREIIQNASKKEIVETLDVVLSEALKEYYKKRKTIPTNIIILRDGVGDGMLDAVHKLEVQKCREAIQAIPSELGLPPKLSFVVVKKRIHTRLILKKSDNTYDNPPPGTLVDTDVTTPNWYDFFLVSQSVNQGTVNPTHYHVIYDETSISSSQLQMLMFQLCHLYYNWAGTIRVPAPCQYAHKLAFQIGSFIHKRVPEELHHCLHYL
eukprot:TRINITY_DN92_c0_g1_i6.p1 TRINITY_DN92_c0_g1~~TRINITY_DN92_c0_g1_i6.p1  ORF type:complete len:708 (-),score=135.14 TRINITY_DN92_c0_g1_i6:114-2237(-)